MAIHPASPKRNYLFGRKRRPSILATSVAALTALCLVPQGVRGQTWVGGTPSNSSDWNTATNWNPATIPDGSTATAIFGSSTITAVSLSTDTQVEGINFTADATSPYTITLTSPVTLTIGDGGISNVSNTLQSFETGVDGAGNSATLIFQGTSTTTSTITGQTQITNDGGAVSGGKGGVTIFQADSSAGTAVIITNSGTNGGSGGTTLFIDNADGGTASAVTNGNGTFDISGLTSGGMSIGSIAGSGIYFLGGNTLTVGGNNTSTTVSGSIADGGQSMGTGGSLAKVGTGTLILTSNANSYTGTTSVTAGTLQIGAVNTVGSIGTGAISLASGGTLSIVDINGDALTRDVSNGVGGIGTLQVNSTVSNTISGTLTDGAAGQLALTQSGTSTTILTNTGNTYSGATTVTGGVLQVGTSGAAGSIGASSAIVLSGGTLSVVNIMGNSLTNNVTNGVGGVGILNNGSTTTVSISGSLTDGGAGQLSFTQTGLGSTILTNSGNTYSGATGVSNGTLQIGVAATAGSIGAGSAVSVSAGGNLFLVNVAGNTLDNNITNGVLGQGTVLINSTNSNTLSGSLTDGGNNSKLALTNAGGITTLTNGGNTYSGPTTISGGDLEIGTGIAAGSIGASSLVGIGNSATLTVVNINGNTLSNAISNGLGGNGTVIINSANTNTLSGVLSDGVSGKLALTQMGAGTTILTKSESYSGATTVNDGTLVVDGSIAAASAVAVNTGGTLAGSGKLAGTVTLSSGATLTPGDSAGPGTLTIGNLILNAGATSTFRLAQDTGTNDLVKVTSNLTLAGNLNVTALAGFGAGVYTLFDYGGVLTNNGFSAINTPAGFTSTVIATSGAVELAVSTNQYWDGSMITGDGTIHGGVGSWNNAAPNWTDSTGTINAQWLNDTAVFQGTAGTVTLIDMISAQGLVFNVDGYTIAASGSNTLTLSGPAPVITVTNAGDTATISAPIAGTLGLIANGAGTLILTNGANTYSGGTTISNGTLQVGTVATAGSIPIGAGTISVSNGGTLSLVNIAGNALTNDVTNGAGGVGTLTVNSANTNTISGALTDGTPGQLALTQSGSGTTILTNGSNTYSGATTVSNGILQIGAAAAPGSIGAGSAVTVSNGATLFLFNLSSNTFTNNVTNSAAGIGTVTIGSSTDLTLSGAFTDGTAGQLSLDQSGSGTTILTNAANTYTAGTLVRGGTLQIGNASTAGSIGTGPVLIQGGGTLTLVNISGNTLANDIGSLGGGLNTVNIDSANSNALSGALTDGPGGEPLALAQSGSGITILTNSGNTYTGATTITSGILQIGNASTAGSIGANSAVTVASGGTLSLVNVSADPFVNDVTNGLGALGTLNVDSANTVTLSGTLTDGAAGQLALTQSGSGTTILTNSNNSYTGATEISGGILQIGTASLAGSIGSGAIDLNTGGTLTLITVVGNALSNNISNSVGGTVGTINVEAPNLADIITLSGALTDGSGQLALTQAGNGTVILTSNANSFTGATSVTVGTLQIGDGTSGNLTGTSGVTVSGSGTLAIDLADKAIFSPAINLSTTTSTLNAIESGTNTISGAITGSGAFNQNGSGTTILAGADTFTGATAVTLGTLQVGNGTAGNLTGTSGVTVSSSGTLAIDLANQATFSPGVTLNSATLNAIQSGTNTISGVISGSGAFNQNGTGTTILTGASTFTGTTTVNSGTLLVNGSLVVGNTVTVNPTGTLGGTGTINDAVNVTGGTLQPGSGTTAGTLTVGSLVLGSTSTYSIGLGTASDSVAVLNDLSINGNLKINELGGFGIGNYTLFTYGGMETGSYILTGGSANVTGLGIFTGAISYSNGEVVLTVSLGGAQYWDGSKTTADGTISGGTGNWNASTTNWTNSTGTTNSAWQSQTAFFGGTGGTVTLTSPISAQGLVFNSSGYTLAGSNVLTLTGTTPEIDVTANTSATVGVRIAGTKGLNADGLGTLILTNGSNGYSGGTNVESGILQVGTAAIVGSLGTGAISLSNGGSLSVVNVTGNVLTANVSNGVGGVGTLNIDSAKTNTISGALTDGATGLLALTQSGTGTTILTNGGNTYSGATTVSGGILQVGTSSLAGSISATSAVSIGNGGTLTLLKLSNSAFDSNVTDGLGGTGTLNVNSTGSVTLDGVLSDGSGKLNLTQSGTGTTILAQTETYTGATTVSAGTLQIGNGSTGNLAAGSTVTVTNTGTLAIDLSNGTNKPTFATASVILNGTGTTLKVIDTSTDLFTGIISGTGSFSEAGGGTTILAGLNTYTGATKVLSGTLEIGNATTPGTLGSGAVTIGSGDTLMLVNSNSNTLTNPNTLANNISNGTSGVGTLNVDSTNTNTVSGKLTDGAAGKLALTESGTGTTILTNSGNTFSGATSVGNATSGTAGILQIGTSTLAGSIGALSAVSIGDGGKLVLINDSSSTFANNVSNGFGGTGTLNIDAATSAMTYTLSGTLTNGSGTLAFDQSGAGTTILTNSGNTFTGATTITAGTLQIGTSTLAGSIGNTSAVALSDGSTLSLVNVNSGIFANTIINGVAGTGSANIGTVIINSAKSTTLSGNLSDGTSGQLAVTQNGAGTTILSGSDSYTGATTINAGKLFVTGTLSSNAAAVTVKSGGTLGGTGSITGTVTVDSGGTLTPGGTTTQGTFTIGTLVLNSGSKMTYRLEGEGISGNAVNDLVNVTGNLTLGGTVSIAPLGGFGIGNYTLFTYAGTLTGNSSSLSVAPVTGLTTTVSTATAKQVNLLVSFGTAQFWDGSAIVSTGAIAGGTGNWSAVGNNWTNAGGTANSVWQGGTAFFETPGGTATLTSAISAQGLVFDTNGYTINTGSGSQAFALTLAGTAPQINVTTAGSSAAITAQLIGKSGLTANGAGQLILTNKANSYTGNTRIANGTVQVGTVSLVGSLGAGAISVHDGGTLDLVNIGTAANNVFAQSVSNGVNGNGTLEIDSANSITLSGAITSGTVGKLALTQTGTGTTILSSSGNTYTGATTINGGVLQIGTSTTAGSIGASSAITIGNGASLNLIKLGPTFANSVTNSIGGAATVNINSAANLTLSGVLSDNTSSGETLALTLGGAGTTLVTGNEAYTGATNVNAGTLQVGNGTLGNLGASTNVTIGSATLLIDLASGGSFASNVKLNAAGSTLKAIETGTNTLSGVISGSGSFIQSGTGTTLLSGADTYTGSTSVNAGILIVGNGSTGSLNSANVTVASGAILGFELGSGTSFTSAVKLNGSTATMITADSGSNTFSGAISGTGVFDQNGSGTAVLSATNTYTGATNVNAGTLEVDGSLAAGNAVKVSGSGTLTGAGTVFGNVTLTGGGTINLGSSGDLAGTLTVTGGNWIGSGTVTGLVTVSSGTFNLTNSLTATTGLTITGGTLAQAGTLTGNLNYLSGANSEFDGELAGATSMLTKGGGTSTLVLAGISTYGGATNITSGTLQIGNGFTGNAPDTSVVNIAGGAALVLNLPTGATFSGSIVNKGTLTAGGTQFNNYTISSAISGTGPLTKTGSNTVTLTGTNSDTGNTTLSGGELGLGSTGALGSTGTISFAGGALQFTSSNTTDYSARFSTASGQAYSIDTNGQGVSFAANLTSSGGSLTKSGAGILTLTGANTYTGGTNLDGGELSLGSTGAIGSKGTISFAGGTLQFTSANTADYSARFSTAANQAYSIDTNGQNVTFAAVLGGAGGNNGTLTKLGSGTLTLSAKNTFTGSTTVDDGTLNLALGPNSSNILAAQSALILGGGTLSLTGGGTNSSTVATQTLASLTTSSDTSSSIVLGNATETLTFNSVTIGAGSTLNLNTTSGGANGATLGSAILVLSGQSAGVVNPNFTVTDAGGFGLATVNANNQVVRLSTATRLPGDGSAAAPSDYLIDNNSSGGAGSSTLVVTASESARSITVDTTAAVGTLTLNSGVTLGANTWNFGGNGTNSYAIVPADPGTTTGEALESTTSSHGTINFNNYNAGPVTIGVPILDRSNTAVIFAGPGTTILTGADTYAGGTTISLGTTLQIGNGGPAGSIAGNVTNNGSLIFDLSNDLTLSGAISGPGLLTKTGSDTLTLTGASTDTGLTTISTGALQVGDGSTAGTSLGTGRVAVNASATLELDLASGGVFANQVADSGHVTVNGGANYTVSGLIGGSGDLTASGTGTVTVTAANTFAGGTTVNGTGILQVGNGIAVGSSLGSGLVAVNSGTLELDLASGGLFANTINDNSHLKTIGAGNYTVSGAINGTGDLTTAGTGIVSITGTIGASATKVSPFGGIALNSGELSLASAGAIGSTDPTVLGLISFSGGTLQFTAANTTDYSSLFSTASSQTYKIDTNGQNVTFASVLGSSNGTLTKLGAGTLKLSAANTFAGTTLDNAGTLDLANLNALENSTLDLNGGASIFDSAAGGTAFIVGGLAGSGPLSLTNNAAKPVALTVRTNNTTSTYSGVLSGTGSLTKTGAGTLTLTSSNSYSGGTIISGGTLAVNGDIALGATSTGVTIDGGTLQTIAGVTTNRLITLTSNGGTIDTDGNTSTFNGVISGAGPLTKATNTGTLILTAANTYTGATVINGGTLQVGNGTAAKASISDSSSITTNSAGTLALNLLSGETFASPVVDNGQMSLIGPGAYTVSGAIGGNGGLTQAGSGIVTVSGNNSYAGATSLAGGELSLGSATALGSQALNTNSTNTIFFTGGTLQYLSNSFLTDYSARFSGSSQQAYSIDVATGLTVTFASGLNSFLGTLKKSGAGDLTLTGTSTYTGGTTINGGDLTLGSPGAIGTTGTISFGGGTLQYSANNSTDYSSRFSNASNQAYSIDTSTQNVTFASNLTSSGGSLTKMGTAILTLAGANTYTAGTTINAGTILATNNSGSATGTGTVTVNSGATLGGSGTIGGPVTLNSGGRILPSAGTLGTAGTALHGSSLLWNGGGTVSFQIGTTADDISLSGALTKGSAGTFDIDILNTGITTTATTVTLISFSSTTFSLSDFNLELPVNISGTLAFNATDTALIIENLKDPPPPSSEMPAEVTGATLSAIQTASFDASDASGSNLSSDLSSGQNTGVSSGSELIATPEPGGAALIFLGVGTLLGWHRRRRRG
ncbi:MAG TPA: autotransporter-associated beta strand repeat-containing protein [Chthoniobacter sp.]|jgi:autotransporter-associated beta strand protein